LMFLDLSDLSWTFPGTSSEPSSSLKSLFG
jgi:hypothetical protein